MYTVDKNGFIRRDDIKVIHTDRKPVGKEEGRLSCGLVCSMPLLAKMWARWCYALYESMDEIAKYNGVTFEEVAKSGSDMGMIWGRGLGTVEYMFRFMGHAPWAMVNPSTAAGIVEKGLPPLPLKDNRTGEILTDFKKCEYEAFWKPFNEVLNQHFEEEE